MDVLYVRAPSAHEEVVALTATFLPSSQDSSRYVPRKTLATALITGCLSVLALVCIPYLCGRRFRDLSSRLVGGKEDSAPSWWNSCHVRGPFCDMRRNIKDELDYESRWSYAFLENLSPDKIALYLGFLKRLHQHIHEANVERSNDCPNMLSWRYMEEFWVGQGHPSGRSGRALANFVNSVHANFKKASDAIHKGKAEPPTCAWSEGEPGWGRDMTALELNIKGHERDKFMWTQEKGRGGAHGMDKAAMVTDVDRSVVTKSMADKFNRVFQAGKGDVEYYLNLPRSQQRMLPGPIRWANTFLNFNFGLFSYGDGEPWTHSPKVQSFFYNKIIHGFSIHGRNLTEGNPAFRSSASGMPWIGGVSGSLIDFYLAARHFYSGQELAELMLIDIACLIAGGQHSLGELLFAATEAENEGGNLSFQKNGHSFTYFATPQFKRFVDILNMPDTDFRKASADLKTEGGLPRLYEVALDEFVQRAGPIAFEGRHPSKVDILRARYPYMPELRMCLKLPGIDNFKLGVYNSGGATRAFDVWETDGLQDIEGGLDAEEFVMKLAPRCYNREIIYAEVCYKEMVGKHQTHVTKAIFNAYVNGGAGGSTYVIEHTRALRDKIVARLWGSEDTSDTAKNEDEFTAAYVSAIDDDLLDVHQCVLQATNSKRGYIQKEEFQALYLLAWLPNEATFI